MCLIAVVSYSVPFEQTPRGTCERGSQAIQKCPDDLAAIFYHIQLYTTFVLFSLGNSIMHSRFVACLRVYDYLLFSAVSPAMKPHTSAKT